ncbi:hybrid sensor histidine kinase/response regulator [Pedobacter nutrimenti]|jgi:signal transduction histidine kinase/CheY-like chemotaxis protein|uniref:histidine kinase n=1 Tax=Pedobacter nutrimenti TaxID=1241337 RepID=A0A318UM43_9SPHI|nr:hybrid sensor histidine kinase/response regulator [Pedobacter nutrimenti]PYF77063.1 phospho-acceptor domain-containing protein [Pedobacter nutrimenti]
MKITYTQILSRKILLAFLAFAILLAIAALIVRDSISKKLENISKVAYHSQRDEARPQQALLFLHQAEDDFQESMVSTDTGAATNYKLKLSSAFNEIDTLVRENKDTSRLSAEQRKKVQHWYYKKLQLSDKLALLKHSFDSLLTVYADFKQAGAKPQLSYIKDVHASNKTTKSKSDTIKKEIEVKRKGFFSRIKDAIANKDGGNRTGVIEINHNQTNKIVDSTIRKIVDRDKDNYVKKLQELQGKNLKLLNMQRELINLNSRITGELERIINDLKEINYNISDEFKSMAFKSYEESTALLNKFYLVALFLVLVFATLLIIFVIKLDKSEILLRKENERSVIIAQQKMDLLLHMSHEIRNPLTAIKGFLYIFSQTSLSKRQSDMLDSIRLSSDMLLGTLNDTLDAAKMENSEFKINNDPFNPDFTLKAVIESMEFSATKKKLSLDYHFEGDKEAVLLGDGFRLKQIIINLLSNAIKYTATGGVTVQAKLFKEGDQDKLQVDVIDTGAGIPADQQANLFSKYYQTNSAKGKRGTGLGLYICKQFVKLQGGKIHVKSAADKGSTFSFYIPYKRADQQTDNGVKQVSEDPLSLLNGISILAVDDNELNLKFLEMMTSKWNIKFFKAADGKQALEIIAREDIKIVMTDLQMPEMDGHELIKAIKGLKAPLNRMPVIVISGETQPAQVNNLRKLGFAGFVNKPFVESELIDQIVKALNIS